MEESNGVMHRVLTLLLSAALISSGHAAAVCARDCAEGASSANRGLTGPASAEEPGSCHDDASTPATRHDRTPSQAPLAPRPLNCVGHAQLSLVARPFARIVTSVPHAVNANAILACEANDLLPQPLAADSLVASASPPASDPSPRSFTLRI